MQAPIRRMACSRTYGAGWWAPAPAHAMGSSDERARRAGSFTQIFQAALALGIISRRRVYAEALAHERRQSAGLGAMMGRFTSRQARAAADVAECGDYHVGLAHRLLNAPTQVRRFIFIISISTCCTSSACCRGTRLAARRYARLMCMHGGVRPEPRGVLARHCWHLCLTANPFARIAGDRALCAFGDCCSRAHSCSLRIWAARSHAAGMFLQAGTKGRSFWRWNGQLVDYLVAEPEGGVTEDTRTILLVHGFGAFAEHWRRNVPELAARGYRCASTHRTSQPLERLLGAGSVVHVWRT